jgi:PEP-CTERM motif
MRTIKNIAWTLAASALLLPLATGPVDAGVTCKIVPTWCPPDHDHDRGTSVPEPATIAVLALGACAAGLAARARKKK